MTQLELHAKTRSDQIAIISFLEWIEENNMEIMTKDGGMVCDQPETLAQRSLGIDRRQLDKERRAMLAGLNASDQATASTKV